jgi:hypothetical protein
MTWQKWGSKQALEKQNQFVFDGSFYHCIKMQSSEFKNF